MPFSIVTLNQNLLLDNPTYERFAFIHSELYTLVGMLRQNPAVWTPAMIAVEMKKISSAKWQRYARTRDYLVQEIELLANLLRATPIGFQTVAMQSQLGDMILRHTFKWVSDTGSLQDLTLVFTREQVSWAQWPPTLTNCIGVAMAEYKTPGQHNGLAFNPANTGKGQDDHGLLAGC